MNLRPFKQFDRPDENSFFTMETVASFLVMNFIIGCFWFLLQDQEKRMLWIILITLVIMFTYSILALDWESTEKPKFIHVARALFLAFMNSAYIVFTVTGIAEMITANGNAG